MELSECIKARKSTRKYSNQAIPDAEIREIVTAGLLAPSSRNRKSTEVIIITDKEILKKLASAKAMGGTMLADASCCILVIGNSVLSDAWIEDGTIAMTNMMLKATDLGIGNCWVQFRNRFSEDPSRSAESVIRCLLHIPEEYSVLSGLSLGYPEKADNTVRTSKIDIQKIHYGLF